MTQKTAIQTNQTVKAPAAAPLLLQRACACGRHTSGGGECAECRKKAEGTLQRSAVGSASAPAVPPIVYEVLRSSGQPLDAAMRAYMEPRFGHDFSGVRMHTGGKAAESFSRDALTIGPPTDRYEQEAEHNAAMVVSPRPASSEPKPGADQATAVGHPRFDFSHVRLHTDVRAAESARAVNAMAYTVGRDVVMDPRHYQSQSERGRRLLAHELTHVVQQTGGGQPPRVSRACLGAKECGKDIEGSLDNFVAKTTADPVNKSKETRRQTLCNATPRNPGCTGDGHGREATQLEAFLKSQAPSRVAAIKGIFVDMDMPQQYGAYTNPCSGFTPPITAAPNQFCTFVPNALEKEAAQYNGTAAKIGGKTRRQWSQVALRILTHETEHALFDADPAGTKITGNPCDPNAISGALTELAAIISEFKPVYHKAMGLPHPARETEMNWWFNFWVNAKSESLAGNVKAIRCECDCIPADEYIKHTFEFATKDWNKYETFLYNSEMQKPKWKLNWPVAPPSVPVDELPPSGPDTTLDVQDLPPAR